MSERGRRVHTTLFSFNVKIYLSCRLNMTSVFIFDKWNEIQLSTIHISGAKKRQIRSLEWCMPWVRIARLEFPMALLGSLWPGQCVSVRHDETKFCGLQVYTNAALWQIQAAYRIHPHSLRVCAFYAQALVFLAWYRWHELIACSTV